MSWNYRVVRTTNLDRDVRWALHEVYYDESGAVRTWTEDPIAPRADRAAGDELIALADLRWELTEMLAALDKPVVDGDETKEN